MESVMLKYSLNLLLLASLVLYIMPAEAMQINDELPLDRSDSAAKQDKTSPSTGTSGATSGPVPTPAPPPPTAVVNSSLAAPQDRPHRQIDAEKQKDSTNSIILAMAKQREHMEGNNKTESPAHPKGEGELLDDALVDNLIYHSPQEIRNLIAILQAAHNSSKDGKTMQEIDPCDIPKKLLFVGKPGTGKSALAKAIAQKCGIKWLFYPSSLLANEYQNSGDNTIKRIFEEAAQLKKPCVIIIDELQNLVRRHKNSKDSDASMLMTLWLMLDRYKNSQILFIGTFNYLDDKLPEQIQDRFNENIIEIPLPDLLQRIQILQFYIQQRQKIKFSATFYKEKSRTGPAITTLARATDGFSPRSLEALLAKAVRTAFCRHQNMISKEKTPAQAEVTQKDCLDAMRTIKTASEKVLERHGFLKRFMIIGRKTVTFLSTILPFLWLAWTINQQRRSDALHATNRAREDALLAANKKQEREWEDIFEQLKEIIKPNLPIISYIINSLAQSMAQSNSSTNDQPPSR